MTVPAAIYNQHTGSHATNIRYIRRERERERERQTDRETGRERRKKKIYREQKSARIKAH